jgi:hypothetical protein
MQTFVRLIVGFVTHTLALRGTHTVVTVVDFDWNNHRISKADEDWWGREKAETIGESWCEPLQCRCWLCGTWETVPRHAWSKDHECQQCQEVCCDGSDLDCDGCSVCQELTVKVSF